MAESKGTYKYLAAILLFAISLALHAPLVDNIYTWTFEPDSESCVEVTRSFYFFFKSPSKESLPHTLESYPNYADGDFIASALLANAIAPLCRAGIIKTPLRDSDNSLVIFSMRWAGVFFDALAVVLIFLTLLLISGNTVIAFGICLLYYLLNVQTLHFDFIRIDHYMLFTACLVMYTSLLLFYRPSKNRYYVFAGMAAGLVTGTKINFPFHLLILPITVLFLAYRRKITWRQFFILTAAFLATTAFVYQRWLMYPENIVSTIRDTLQVGEDWFSFWGNSNYSYYFCSQFYNHGQSAGVTLLLILFYFSFIYCLITAYTGRSDLKWILCLVFVLQSIALAISPKIGRYALMMPAWAAVFICISLCRVARLFSSKLVTALPILLLLLPVFGYEWKDYSGILKYSREREVSIQKTRIEPLKWIEQNVPINSVIAVQHAKVSNPPIFDLPYVTTTQFFQYPFLYPDSLAKFYPDSNAISKSVNYIILSDKETDFHLYILKQDVRNSSLYKCWQQYYASLGSKFPVKCFEDSAANYGLKRICIYKVSDSALSSYNPNVVAHDSIANNKVFFFWANHPVQGAWAPAFQVQVSEDSSMQWLVYGSRDGYYSKYKVKNDPVRFGSSSSSFIPSKINDAINRGEFSKVIKVDDAGAMKEDINTFFANVFFAMKNDSLTLRQSLKQNMGGDNPGLYNFISQLYGPAGDILNSHVEDYLKITGLKPAEVTNEQAAMVYWKFIPPIQFTKGKKYYWRVRVNNHTTVLTNWSKVQSFEL